MGVQSLVREDPLEKEMATHPSIVVWRIPRTGEPGGLQSTESQSGTQLKRLSTRTLNIRNYLTYFHLKLFSSHPNFWQMCHFHLIIPESSL